MTDLIRSMPGIVETLRVWRDERGITHEVFDEIAGFPLGYAGKLLAPEPIKNLGWMSLGAALDTLAIAFVVVENPEQRKLVEKRWTPRERPKNGAALAPRFSTAELQAKMERTQYMKMIGKRGGQKGGKRRL